MANSFHYYAPTEVVFGKETHKKTGWYIRKYSGTKVLIVYGGDHVGGQPVPQRPHRLRLRRRRLGLPWSGARDGRHV